MSIFYQTELSEQKETQKLIIHSSPSSTEAKRSSKNSECCQIQPSSELIWNINVMMHLVQNQIDSGLPACDVLAVCSPAMRCRVTLLLSAAAFFFFFFYHQDVRWKYTQVLIRRKRERDWFSALCDTHFGLWPLFLASCLLFSSPSGIWKWRLSCWFHRGSGCREVRDDNCCLSLWMAAGVPSMRRT